MNLKVKFTPCTQFSHRRYVIAVYGIRGRLNRLPAGCSGDMVLASVKKVIFTHDSKCLKCS